MAYLMAITRNIQVSEEIFQNAAVVVMETAATGTTINDPRAWSKEVVRRQALAYLKSESRHQHKLTPTHPALLAQIQKIFDQQPLRDQEIAIAEREALKNCIDSLPAENRRLLAMRYEQKAAFVEIADAVDRTAAAVQRALSRTRKQLRDCIEAKLSGATA